MIVFDDRIGGRTDRAGNIVLRGQRGDGAGLGDAAVFAGIEADGVAAIVSDQFAGFDGVEAAFVGEDFAAGFAAEARQFMELAPLTVIGPAAAIVFASLTFVVLANGLREMLDVASR